MPTDTHTWHAPTDHEHGDQPPAWADAFSCAQFGHPVVFGGDESTPGEAAGISDPMVFVAFKGFAFEKYGVDLYLRVHLHTNPHGRSTIWHSYEMYARDASGSISFWQGWLPFGTVVQGGGIDGSADMARVPYKHHIAGADIAGEVEVWYAGNSELIPWTWDLVIRVYDPVTLYNAGENINPHAMSQWEWTGKKGLTRDIQHAIYYSGGIGKYPDRNNPPLTGWFCATGQGQITTTGSADCASGELPQYVAPTMPALPNPGGMTKRTYSCPSCDTLN